MQLWWPCLLLSLPCFLSSSLRQLLPPQKQIHSTSFFAPATSTHEHRSQPFTTSRRSHNPPPRLQNKLSTNAKKTGNISPKQPASSRNEYTLASFPHFNFAVRTRSSSPYRKTKTRAQNRKKNSLVVTRLLPLLQIKQSTNAKVTKFYKRTGKKYVLKYPVSSRNGFALASLLHFKFVVRTRSSDLQQETKIECTKQNTTHTSVLNFLLVCFLWSASLLLQIKLSTNAKVKKI